MKNASKFNEIAQNSRRLKPLLPVIALFEELKSWGPDSEGHVFSYEIAYNREGRPFAIGNFNKPNPLQRELESPDFYPTPHIIAGFVPDIVCNEFMVYTGWRNVRETWAKTPEDRVDSIIHGGSISYESVVDAVEAFAAKRMTGYSGHAVAVKTAPEPVRS